MRKLITVSALAVACAMPGAARAQGAKNEVQGFGGVTVGTATSGSAVSTTFGGRVGVGLTPNLQLFGEAGRLAGFESPTFDVLDFTDIAVHLSALYGEGGIRFIAVPRSAVRPYAEATAGVARLNASFSGLNGRTDPIIGTALDLINTTRPMLGAGAGVLFSAGRMSVDVGYRYKRFSPGDTVASLLNEGKDYQINQLRVGLGVRF